MKVLENNVVEYNYKNIWTEFCQRLLKVYDGSKDFLLKDEIMMLTEAYSATLAYIKWHWYDMYNCDAPESDMIGSANGVFDGAVEDVLRREWLKEFIIKTENPESYIILNMIREIIYEMIIQRIGMPRKPSVLSFAEFGAFSNIDLSPNPPIVFKTIPEENE